MAKVREIYEYIDSIAPFGIQQSWDNSGLIVGDMDKTVETLAVILDITPAAITKARALDVGLIVCHHPPIFKAVKTLLAGDVAYELARAGISVIAAHTNLDAAPGGVNDILAKVIGLEQVVPLPTSEEEPSILRMGTLSAPLADSGMSPDEFALHLKECLEGATVRYTKGRTIRTVAVCGGAGGSSLKDVIAAGADCYVTGDADHHEFLEAAAAGITLVAAGHFNTEDVVVKPLAQRIASKFPEIRVIRLKQCDPVSTC